MYLIGLTGGIASGKSTIARRLAELGAVHIDADQLAREAVEPGTSAIASIAHRFGTAVLHADGSLDRAALGSIVFSDPASLAALNAIVHPAVRHLTAVRIADAERNDPQSVVVYDVPLLVEAQVPHRFDLVVVAHAAVDTRIERLTTARGMTPDEARRRVASQASDGERLAVADLVIDTDGDLDATLAQADALWERVRRAA
ncbi:dephospho-CoA kinase [Mycetocola sp. CAN_C7]|uniref:dephospho-CoA kinase n=1 Tax=Mycetocola sp. CAN_C7 TaxID=2787724 RepID=UPI0018C9C37B